MKKFLTKESVKKEKDKYANLSLIVGTATVVGIICAHPLILVALLLIIGGGVEYYSLKKINKLNEIEKKLS